MNIKKFNKAQAALEFLTTYGWAFLVIIIMIGALAYFGILSPSKLLPNRCNFGSEFGCIDYQIDATANTFKIRLKNGLQQAEIIPAGGITISSESATPYTCTLTTPALPFTWTSGTTQDFIWGTCNSAAAGFVPGEKGKVLISIDYFSTTSGSTYQRTTKGEVFTTIK